jgi:hypothetical protein
MGSGVVLPSRQLRRTRWVRRRPGNGDWNIFPDGAVLSVGTPVLIEQPLRARSGPCRRESPSGYRSGRSMSWLSKTSLMTPTIVACFVATVCGVNVATWDQDPIQDALADDLLSPWCRIGSLQSWQGRPCVVPMGPAWDEGTAGTR